MNYQLIKNIVIHKCITEVQITWNLIQSNLVVCLVPIIISSMVAWNLGGNSIDTLPLSLGLVSLFGFLYVYTFDITQQILSIPEDKINKPTRPLVTGVLSKRDAIIRCAIMHIAFFIFGLIFNILIYVVMWQIVSIFYKFSKYWIYKNFFIFVGVISMLVSSWELVGVKLPQEIFIWILVMAANNFFIVTLQDLRDVKGDLAIGRKTFPIVYGMKKTRYYLAILYIVANPILNHFYFFAPGAGDPIVLLLEIITSSLCVYLGLRILYNKTRENDKITYTLYVGWYLLILVSVNFIFNGVMSS